MKAIVIILIIALILGGLFIVSTNRYDLSTKDGRIGFAKAYSGWAGNIAKNIYSVTAYAVKLDWIPKS